MFDLGKFNPFKKHEAPQEVETDVAVQEEKEEVALAPKLSLEEELELVEEKKKEIEVLSKKRQDLNIDSKNLEEKILMSGVTEKKAEAIRKRIMDISGDIGDQIQAIRKEFEIETTPVEVYRLRLEMIQKEIQRIQNNRAPEYRVIDSKIINFLGEDNDNIKRRLNSMNGSSINLFIESLQKENKDMPEIEEFLKEMYPLNKYGQEDNDKIYKGIIDLKSKIKEKIQENTTYKTPADDREALIRLERLVKLSDDILRVLIDAENKEGQFKKPNPKYF